jgi:hypothetical protein
MYTTFNRFLFQSNQDTSISTKAGKASKNDRTPSGLPCLLSLERGYVRNKVGLIMTRGTGGQGGHKKTHETHSAHKNDLLTYNIARLIKQTPIRPTWAEHITNSVDM